MSSSWSGTAPTEPPMPDCEYVLEEDDQNDNHNNNMNDSNMPGTCSTTLLLSPVPRPLDDALSRRSQKTHDHNQPTNDNYDDDDALASLPTHHPNDSLTTPFLARDTTHASLRSLGSGNANNNNNNNTSQHPRQHIPELNGLNYLNVVAYFLHLFVSWGIGVWGLDGILLTRWELSMRYLTLLMPARWAYYLWCPILALEAAFALAQLHPEYRSRPLVQAGTAYYFFYLAVWQTAWTLCFSFKLFVCSFASVLLALGTLLALLRSQATHMLGGLSRTEFLFLRLPFCLHAGWMILFAVDHFSLLFRYYHASIGLQVAVDIFGLGILLAIAMATALWPPTAVGDGWVIPTVILWAYAGISWRLWHVDPSMIQLYGNETVSAVRYSVYFFTGAVGICGLAPKLVVWIAHEFLTIQVVELHPEEA